MSNILKLFTAHPAGAGQNYFTHMLFAFTVSLKLLVATITAFLHAFFPFTFQKLTGRIVEDLYGEILKGRERAAAFNRAAAPQP